MADPVIVPSTRLEATNVIIGTIGTAPLNSLEGNLTADISMAVNILDETSREVQSKGWHFNTEKEYPLNRNLAGEINLAANILRADLKNPDYHGIDAVQRGRRLYDRIAHSYIFTTNVKAEVILGLPFEDMPECARYHITIKAARKFQARTVGSDTLDGFTKGDEFDTLTTLKELEGDTGDFNIFNNYDTASALDRSRG